MSFNRKLWNGSNRLLGIRYEVKNNDVCGGDLHLSRTLYQRLHRLSDFHEILYSNWAGVNFIKILTIFFFF